MISQRHMLDSEIFRDFNNGKLMTLNPLDWLEWLSRYGLIDIDRNTANSVSIQDPGKILIQNGF